jgi:DNA polymerase-3 subunit gamma/tau
MNRAMNRRVEFEMALIKLCGNIRNTSEAIDNSEIYDKIKQLEDKINNAPVQQVQSDAPSQQQQQPEVLTASSPPTEADPAPTVDIRTLKPSDLIPCERWGEVLEEFKKVNPAVAGSLDGSAAATAGNIIFITSQNRFFITLFKVRENAVSLGSVISHVLGQRYIIKARCTTTVEEQKDLAQSLIKKAIDNKIETAVENSAGFNK